MEDAVRVAPRQPGEHKHTTQQDAQELTPLSSRGEAAEAAPITMRNIATEILEQQLYESSKKVESLEKLGR